MSVENIPSEHKAEEKDQPVEHVYWTNIIIFVVLAFGIWLAAKGRLKPGGGTNVGVSDTWAS